jgi:hypothetical protein
VRPTEALVIELVEVMLELLLELACLRRVGERLRPHEVSGAPDLELDVHDAPTLRT